MLKKLICIILATTVLYITPAYAISKSQFENMITEYTQDNVSVTVQRECRKYNVRPPKFIKTSVTKLDKSNCGILLGIFDDCDPRVVAVAADMIAMEAYNILKRHGWSDKKMQQDDFHVLLIPVKKGKNDKVITYNASILYWDGKNLKLDSIDAELVQSALNSL